MIKVWAILENVGTEYKTVYPTVLADSLESIKNYIKKTGFSAPLIIAYKELDKAFMCGYDEGDLKFPDWTFWEGRKYVQYTFRNLKTGELNPNVNYYDGFFNHWEEGNLYHVYKEGKLVEERFERL